MTTFSNSSPRGFKAVLLGIIKYFWIILLVIGALLFFNPKCGSYLLLPISKSHEFGAIILTSGIIGGLVKSLQFTGVFKEELEEVIRGQIMAEVLASQASVINRDKIIKGDVRDELNSLLMTTDHLSYRSDLPELWKNISDAIYEKKFPLINDDLQRIILMKYFPTDHDFYYKDFHVSIEIKEITPDFVIKYIQTSQYYVIMGEGRTETELIQTSHIEQDVPEPIVNELIYFKINEKKVDIEEHEDTVDNKKKVKYEIPLSGCSEYFIESQSRREFSLRSENFLLHRQKYLTSGMIVDITYPTDSVDVSFFNIGMVDEFKLHLSNGKGRIGRIHKNSVILPHQGFGLSFERIDFNKKM